jgi:hypothetical protein
MQVYGLQPPSDELAAKYNDLYSVPDSVIQHAVVPWTQEDAKKLCNLYLGTDRMGPANAHGLEPVTMLDQAMAGAHAVPPIPAGMPERVAPTGGIVH